MFDFIVQKLYALRKPKTNIQILQQSVLLKNKYVISFLKEHAKEVYIEVRAAYVDTMNKAAESKLAKFVEDIIVPPRMVDIIVDGEVNEEYFRTLEILSKKLKFVEADQLIKGSKALKDVQPELEKLRQKAVTKVDNSTRCLMELISV